MSGDTLGFAPAAYEIGRMWFFGEGRPVDREKAFTYFEKAARQGHLFAQRNVARGMMSGRSGLVGRLSGGLLFVKVLLRAVKVGWADPDSERLFRQ
jgi:hypothetical protein